MTDNFTTLTGRRLHGQLAGPRRQPKSRAARRLSSRAGQRDDGRRRELDSGRGDRARRGHHGRRIVRVRRRRGRGRRQLHLEEGLRGPRPRRSDGLDAERRRAPRRARRPCSASTAGTAKATSCSASRWPDAMRFMRTTRTSGTTRCATEPPTRTQLIYTGPYLTTDAANAPSRAVDRSDLQQGSGRCRSAGTGPRRLALRGGQLLLERGRHAVHGRRVVQQRHLPAGAGARPASTATTVRRSRRETNAHVAGDYPFRYINNEGQIVQHILPFEAEHSARSQLGVRPCLVRPVGQRHRVRAGAVRLIGDETLFHRLPGGRRLGHHRAARQRRLRAVVEPRRQHERRLSSRAASTA